MGLNFRHISLLCTFLFIALGLQAQECPELVSPMSGSTNVPVDQTISWGAVPEIPGYRIALGTSPGASDILEQSVGSATSFTPPFGLPENTTIYVTVILDFLFEGGDDIVCPAGSFTTAPVTTPPACATINFPVDGADPVSIFTSLIWSYTPTATGYVLNIGTSPGASDVFSGDVGNVLSFNPPGDFPPTTTLYVELQPYNAIGAAVGPCTPTTFTTGIVQPLPSCTSLLTPANGDTNVPLTPLLEWLPVADADGYRVTIGDSPFNANILDNVVFTTNSTFVIDFLPNKVFFIKIVPFNSSGDALGCGQETFSTILGCGPYYDPELDEFVDLSPQIDIPALVSFCENESPYVISTDDIADGYRWYRVFDYSVEQLISETNEVSLDEVGTYRYEAYNLINQLGDIVECISTQEFEVVSSEPATITGLDVQESTIGLDISVNITGFGDYEFSLNDPNGPYQDSNVFTGLPVDIHTFYVRDNNGCGTVQIEFVPDIFLEGFPKFFTPNGDGINDYWQFIPPENSRELLVEDIMIFDRVGTFIAQIDPMGRGWDGTFNGQPLPANTYWFKATNGDKEPVTGYFALKR